MENIRLGPLFEVHVVKSSKPGVLWAVLTPVLWGAACRRTQGAAATGRPPRSAVPVRVAPAALQDVVFAVKAVGGLEAEEVVQVTAEVEGAVSEVRFHEGDRVTRGTVLARIDPDRYRLEA